MRLPTLWGRAQGHTESHSFSTPGTLAWHPQPSASWAQPTWPPPHVALSPSGAQASVSVLCVALAQSPFPLPPGRKFRILFGSWRPISSSYHLPPQREIKCSTSTTPRAQFPQPRPSTALALGFYSIGFHRQPPRRLQTLGRTHIHSGSGVLWT